MAYRVYVRSWWREFQEYDRRDGFKPGDLVPNSGGRKHTIGKVATIPEAQQMCKEYNRTHKPGRYSRKAEFEEIW